MAADWHVGQKIVCIKVDGFDGEPVPDQVQKFLELGVVYQIRGIVPSYPYLHRKMTEKRLGFHLVGIYPNPAFDPRTNQFETYVFCSERFKPLEEKKQEDEISLPASITDSLDQVNKGLIKFDDTFEREWKKQEEKQKEEVK